MEDRGIVLDEQTVDELIKEAESVSQQPESDKKTSLLIGVIGATVGGIVAVILWITLAILIQGTFGIIGGFIVGSFVYLGYLTFGGKRGKCLLVTLSIATVIFTFIGLVGYILVNEYLNVIAYNENYVYSMMGTHIPFSEILAMSGETMMGFITSSLGEFINAVLGSMFTFSASTFVLTYTTSIIALFVYYLRERHLGTYMHVKIGTDSSEAIAHFEHEMKDGEVVEVDLIETIIHTEDGDIEITEVDVYENPQDKPQD